MKQQVKIFIIFLIFSIIINALLLHFFYKPKRMAVLDMQNIVNEYIQGMGNKDYDDKEAEKFIAKMKNLTDKVARDNNLIIVPKQVVFSGEDADITEQFKEALKNAN